MCGLLLFIYSLLSMVIGLSDFMQNQINLYDDLFRNYSSEIGVVNTLAPSSPFKVHIKTGMFKLVTINEPEETVTFLFDLQTTWTDERLTWNRNDYGGIDHIYVPLRKVWVPEITISDCTKQKTFLDKDMEYAWIYENGSVTYYHAMLVSTICEMDVFRFPLDSHTCGINILFHTYVTGEYEIVAEQGVMPKPVKSLGNGEWQMESMGVNRQVVGDNVTVINTYEATFKRNPSFYIILIILPAYFINALSMVALFYNIDDKGEKYQIGLTNIMSMSFIMAILADDLPKTKSIPMLAIYVLISLALMIASLATVMIIPKLTRYLRDSKRFGMVLPSKVAFVLMIIFQLANLFNFIALFL